MLVHYLMLIISLLFGHPLHVTITSIDLDPEQGEINVSHRFFTDDFTLLFFHLYERNIVPKANQEFSDADLEIIQQYLSDAFVIKSGWNSAIRLDYVRKEQDGNSILLFFKGSIPEGENTSFSLTDEIMLDLFIDHKNLVIVAVNGKEEGYTFDFNERAKTIVFINQ